MESWTAKLGYWMDGWLATVTLASGQVVCSRRGALQSTCQPEDAVSTMYLPYLLLTYLAAWVVW